MFNNKRAFTLEEGITLLLAALIIIATYKIVSPFLNYSDKDKDTKSLPNFEDRLIPAIQDLLENSKKIDYSQIKYFLGPERAVVGYNKAWDPTKNLEIVGLKIEKHGSCSDKACLCFFKEAVINNRPLKCIKFDKVTYFLKDTDASIDNGYGNPIRAEEIHIFYETTPTLSAPDAKTSSLPKVFTQTEYKYLLLNGATFKNKDQTIYIEKYENQKGEITLYIAPINENTREKIEQRKSYIDTINTK